MELVQANILRRPKKWEFNRKIASENGDESRCYQEGCLKRRFQQSWLTVFCLLGGRGLGHRCKQGQKGQHSPRSSTSPHRKAASSLRGSMGVAYEGVWNPAGLELEKLLGLSSSMTLRF